MTTGDQLWTDDNARAELHIGAAGLRLGPQTAFQFLNLDDQTAQVQITQGTVYVHLRILNPGQVFEVDTPSLAFTLSRPGTYRIDAHPDNSTTVVTVRAGEGQVTGGGQYFPLEGSQQLTAYGTDQVSFDVETAPAPDNFDNWCWGRIQREEHSASLRYVNPEMIGFQDLDDNGSWRVDATYGNVWVPRSVPGGWAPYHYGHWAWVDPWGWTWVDDASWGFAPFHYGRWAYVGNTWGWIPGPVAVRPVYAPALVAWVGGGGGWGASLSFGGGGAVVAWVPLGPREVWVPSYHVSQAYFANVNTSNTVITNVNITQVYNTTIINHTTNVTIVNYANARAPNAVIAVSANAMASARPVNQISKPVSAQELSRAQVVTTAAVVPQREAVLGHPSGTPSASRPPARALSTPIVARTQPPPAPVSFASRQSAMQQHPGQPMDSSAVQHLRASSPAPATARPAIQIVKATQSGPPPKPGQRTAPARQVTQGSPAGAGRPGVNAPPQQAAHPQSATPEHPVTEKPVQQAKPANAPPQHPLNARPEQEAKPANVPAEHPEQVEKPAVQQPHRPTTETTRPAPEERAAPSRPQPQTEKPAVHPAETEHPAVAHPPAERPANKPVEKEKKSTEKEKKSTEKPEDK